VALSASREGRAHVGVLGEQLAERALRAARHGVGGVPPPSVHTYKEVFERSRSKSSPLEQTRLKLANPVEINGFDRD